MNGLDLLFIVFGLLLLLGVWIGTAKYLNWLEWDDWRRRQRMLDRQILQDEINEKEYRRVLRLFFHINGMTHAFKRLAESATSVNEHFTILSSKLINSKLETLSGDPR